MRLGRARSPRCMAKPPRKHRRGPSLADLCDPLDLEPAYCKSVAVELLHALAALLRFERQRGRGTREQARNADRLAGLLAIAVAAVLDHAQRLFDFLEQLAFPIAGAKL